MAGSRATITGLLAALFSLAAPLAPGPASAQSPGDIAAIATYMGPDRQDRLIEGARREGGLTLYSSATNEDMAVIVPMFEKKYGLKVKMWRGDAAGILQRIVTEARGGHDEFDLAETGGNSMEALHREGLLQAVTSPVLADISPRGRYPHGEWTANRFQIQTNAYNTSVVPPGDVPRDWTDLAQPKWKGKMSMEADNAIWFGTVVNWFGEDKGLAIMRAIGANGVSLRKGHTLLANLVVSGEASIGLGLYGYKVEQLSKQGAPIAALNFVPSVVHAVGVGLSRKASHPYSALLFYDFMLTDVQRVYLDQDTQPTNIKVKAEPAGAVYMDHAAALDNLEKWTRQFKETFGARAR